MTDFISGLRGDLVDAADLHRRRRVRRTWPAVWRPALAVATAAAAAIGVLFAADTLSPDPVRPAIAQRAQLGGQPQDAVLAAGSLWVTDFEGRVLRVDPADGRVTARIGVPGHPDAVAAGAGGIWVSSPSLAGDAGSTVVSRIDPVSGRVVDRFRVPGYADAIAAGAGGVWLIDDQGRRLERIDPAGQEVTARVPLRRAGAVVASDARLWAVADDGAVVSVDGGTLAVDRLSGALAFGHGPAGNTLAPDPPGAWVVGRGDGTVLRIEAGRVTSRVAVDDALGPIAVGDGAVWVVAGDPDLRGSYTLARIDRETGEAGAPVDVGRAQPKALVAVGGDVWVIAGDGSAVLVSADLG